MLRSEFPFPIQSRAARFTAFILGEAFLGFLAIIAVALTLFQMLFSLKPAGDALVTTAQLA